jgi:glycosyltransferase involved in cell wall biosynthesis
LSKFKNVILTLNEETDIVDCLKSVAWCDDIHVFDSFSSDRTVEIARKAGATVTQRKFDNWAAHQNWGIANIPFRHQWVLYVDADEQVSEGLRNAILSARLEDCVEVAFKVQRRDFAWNGRWLKHAQISPYYLRIFRPEKMHYRRLVNPVSVPDGPQGMIKGFLDHYPFSKGFRAWWQRHLSYADFEAAMRLEDLNKDSKFSLHKALFAKEFSERRYHQKGLFYKLPARPLVKWFYIALWRRSFLDGVPGLTYATLQSIYEYFIVLKTRELVMQAQVQAKSDAGKLPTLLCAKDGQSQ